jgi:hypothetical protein
VAYTKKGILKSRSDVRGVGRIYCALPKDVLSEYVAALGIKGVGYIVPNTVSANVQNSMTNETHQFVYSGEPVRRFSTNKMRPGVLDRITTAYVSAIRHAVEFEEELKNASKQIYVGSKAPCGISVQRSEDDSTRCRIFFTYYPITSIGPNGLRGVRKVITTKTREADALEFDSTMEMAQKLYEEGLRNLGEYGVAVGTHVRKNDPRIKFI